MYAIVGDGESNLGNLKTTKNCPVVKALLGKKKDSEVKKISQGKDFNYDKTYEVLSGKYFDKPRGNKNPKFTKNIVQKYVTENSTINEVEKIIEELLEDYFIRVQESEDME